MPPTRHRRTSAVRDLYDPTHSSDDPGADPAVRLLDLLLQLSLDARHPELRFSSNEEGNGAVSALAEGEWRILLRAPAEAMRAFVARLKLLAGLPADAPAPQTGVIYVRQGDRPLAVDLLTSPGAGGEDTAVLAFEWQESDPPSTGRD